MKHALFQRLLLQQDVVFKHVNNGAGGGLGGWVVDFITWLTQLRASHM